MLCILGNWDLTHQHCAPCCGCRLPSNAICPYVYVACNGSVVYASDTQRCQGTCNPLVAPSPSPQAASITRPAWLLVTALLSLVALFALLL